MPGLMDEMGRAQRAMARARRGRAGVDVGVIAGSRCQEIWDEHSARHPGIAAMRLLHDHRCKCPADERASCFRRMVQRVMAQLGEPLHGAALLEALVGETDPAEIEGIVRSCLNASGLLRTDPLISALMRGDLR